MAGKRRWFRGYLNAACVLMLMYGTFIVGCKRQEDRDILQALSEGKIKRKWPSAILNEEFKLQDTNTGVTRTIKYGDQNLQEAEEVLTGVYPRPWSQKRVHEWFKVAKNEQHKIALLRLLTVTGSDIAAWCNGQVLEAEKGDPTHTRLYFSAIENIDTYFVESEPGAINASKTHEAAWTWWRANRSKLRKLVGE